MDKRIVPYVPPFPAKGSHLLKEFANTGTPILDSLVRESIQNSLDAAIIPTKPVFMNFSVCGFDKEALFKQCEGLESMLKPKFPNIPEIFICFRDYNTEGLTGNIVDKGDQNTGNYFKLVLDIGNEQTGEGAGGAWGIGKSLYFRIGVKGFVIYYSRIKLDNGNYESRLIAMMVENERGTDSVIPAASLGTSKTGIAYWGRLENDIILPITDEEEIKEVLNIFNIELYKDNETGTAIILPFIDEARLLADNQKVYTDGNEQKKIYWRNSIEEFLKISIQRWYFARLNNNLYKDRSRLLVSINGTPFSFEDMEPCFKIFQALYNRAAGYKEEELDDILRGKEDVRIEEVAYGRKPAQLNNKKTGTLAYALVDKQMLGMEPPTSNYSPYIYCDTDIQDFDTNTPIIGYCRKPAMIVNYETAGDWLYRVPNSDCDHFLLAIFVLNSGNRVGNDSNLEEYVRKMEPNDHMKWVDSTFNGNNYRFIKNTKTFVSNILGRFLSNGEQSDYKKMMSELGKIYSWILPPEDFGKKPGPPPGGGDGIPKDHPRSSLHRKIKYTITSQKLFQDKVEISYTFESDQKKNAFGMRLLVGTSDGKNISLKEWEEMGAAIPFYIKSAIISLKKLDGNTCSKLFPISFTKPIFDDIQLGLHLELELLPNTSEPFMLNIKFDTEHSFVMDIKLVIHISSRRAMPTINII